MKIDFIKNYTKGSVIVFSYAKQMLTSSAKEFDKRAKGALKKAISSSKFEGKEGEIISIMAPQGIDGARLICIGLGEKKELGSKNIEKIGAIITKALLTTKEADVNVIYDDSIKISPAHLGFGMTLAAYKFENYKSEKSKDTLKKITIITADVIKAKKEFKSFEAIAAGIYSARDFISEPPNVLTPEVFANRTKEIMTKLGVKTEIFDEKKLIQKNMNLIMAVGGASVNRPRLVVLSYMGAKNKSAPPVALVGKGLCFDSGGLCIKPGSSMLSMKQDMSGAAAVIGAIQSLALQKAPVNVIGVIPMVENSIAGNAYRPDDVIKSYSGKTIEVINTDAEGRLVLADALWFAQEYKPSAIINLATLTGAIMAALAHEYAGLFSNDKGLSEKLKAAGYKTNEKLWDFPMDKVYDDMLKSDIADFRHTGKGGLAGSITAACFLKRFIKDGTKWAHLDIAGVAYVESKTNPLSPCNATGFGVYLLNTLILDNFV